MADRVAVINRGILQQVDSPQKLYDGPDNLFVAAFIGSPSMNLMEAMLSETDGGVSMQLGSQSVAVPSSVFERKPSLREYLGRSVTVGIRPEDFGDGSIHTDHPADQRLRVQAGNIEALGFERLVYFELDAVPVFSEDALDLEEEDEEVLSLDATRVSARFEPSSTINAGDAFETTVTVANAHFFDPESGLAVR